MTAHVTTLTGNADHWQARCSCRWRSKVGARGDAQAEQDHHVAQVSRAQAGLGVRTPSLRTLRSYYLQQADDPANTEDERSLWQQLADELTPFIKAKTDTNQLNLWE